nr:uncharacterized protein LOC105725630 [Aotus nancymaae]
MGGVLLSGQTPPEVRFTIGCSQQVSVLTESKLPSFSKSKAIYILGSLSNADINREHFPHCVPVQRRWAKEACPRCGLLDPGWLFKAHAVLTAACWARAGSSKPVLSSRRLAGPRLALQSPCCPHGGLLDPGWLFKARAVLTAACWTRAGSAKPMLSSRRLAGPGLALQSSCSPGQVFILLQQ